MKEKIKSVLKKEILDNIVYKGDLKSPSTNFELMDLHGNFEDKKTLTTYGGHFQQLYYVVSSIFEIYGDDLTEFYERRKSNPSDDTSKKAMNARELLVEQFFLPFLVSYLRDSKMEAFSIMATPALAKVMAELKVSVHDKGHYELAKMSKEAYIHFRYHFLENRMGYDNWKINRNEQTMNLLLSSLLLIMCKKIPSELGLTKIDMLHNKVKLMAPPAGNTEEKPVSAVVRISSLKKPPGSSQHNTISDDDEPEPHKAFSVNGRRSGMPYTVPVINTVAARAVREDFANAMVKVLPDFFSKASETNHLRKILQHAEKKCADREEKYIAERCSEYDLPLFDLPLEHQ